MNQIESLSSGEGEFTKEIIDQVRKAFQDSNIPPKDRYIWTTKETYEKVSADNPDVMITWDEFIKRGDGTYWKKKDND